MCGNWLGRIARRIGLLPPQSSMYQSSGSSEEKRALIVVDVQNDFITGSLALSNCPSKHDGSEVVEPINKLVTSPFWDIVAYSKDWHPPNHISFVTNVKQYTPHADNKVDMDSAQVFDYCIFDVEGTRIDQVLWPAHCIQNSDGAEFHKDLTIVPNGITIHKGINYDIDSYSAFYDNGRRSETILRQVLQDAGITEVYVCGLATDVCVNFTAFDAKSLGFKTIVIEDCCRGVDSDKCEETFHNMKGAGMDIVTSDEVSERAQKALDEGAQKQNSSHPTAEGASYFKLLDLCKASTLDFTICALSIELFLSYSLSFQLFPRIYYASRIWVQIGIMWLYFYPHFLFHMTRWFPKNNRVKFRILSFFVSICLIIPEFYVLLQPKSARGCDQPLLAILVASTIFLFFSVAFAFLFTILEPIERIISLAFHLFGLFSFILGVVTVAYTFQADACAESTTELYYWCYVSSILTLICIGETAMYLSRYPVLYFNVLSRESQ